MKIITDFSDDYLEQIEVVSAQYVGNYVIRILFSDGSNRQVDFKPFLESSVHPSIRKYLDEEKFKGFEIVDGNLNWNDYDLIFPLEDLFKGMI
jgi:Protein of unknown function (DUF2442)